MKKRVVKELEIDVCDICESEVDNEFRGLLDAIDSHADKPYVGMGEDKYEVCSECYTNVLKPFLERMKLTK